MYPTLRYMPRQQQILEESNGNTASITLRVPPLLWEKFKRAAAADGRSASSAVRQAMRQYMQTQLEDVTVVVKQLSNGDL